MLLGSTLGRAVLSGGVHIATPYPSDAVFALSAARKVVKSYRGAHCIVHRSSDSATLTIGFGSNGAVDIASARAFRGNGTLWVDRVYDQTGSGNDFTPITASTVELVLDGPGGKPAFGFYGNGGLSCSYNAAFALTGDQSIVSVVSHTSAAGYIIGTLDGSNNGWAAEAGTGGKVAYFSKTKGAFSLSTTATNDGFQRSSIITRTSGAMAFFLQNVADGTATGHGNIASGATVFIGSDAAGTGTKLNGLISEIALYSRALSAGERAAIAADHVSYYGVKNPVAPAAAFKGASGLKFIASSYVNTGATLLYERTQPFTILAAVYLTGRPNIALNGAMLIFCNVGGSPFPGYELWYDWTGNLRSRIIHDQPGLNSIDVVGSLSSIDAGWHVVGMTYAGNALASGVKFFIDGVKDQNTRAITDNLTGSSIGTSGRIGNQAGFESTFYMRGAVDELQIHNVERSEAYMAAHMAAATYPTLPDANIQGYWKFDEGSGTSAADSSTNGFAGTLTGSPVWLSAGA